MTKSVIEPTPTAKEYTEGDSYQSALEANAVPIFDEADPIALFERWMGDARQSEVNDSNAMALSTVDASGMPDVRMVLLKGVSADGFTFFTNERSAKGRHIKASGKAALCFHWKSLRRQVRLRGVCEPLPDAASDAYFASRARASQLGAWASDQSAELSSRAHFEQELADIEARFEGRDVPRPDFWYGWQIVPSAIEFWRDRPFRLHDRLVFTRDDAAADWAKSRLYP